MIQKRKKRVYYDLLCSQVSDAHVLLGQCSVDSSTVIIAALEVTIHDNMLMCQQAAIMQT